MQFIPIKTRIVQPPEDDLFAVMDESLTDVQAGDVLVVSSKVVAISEGRCVSADEKERARIATEIAQVIIPRDYWRSPLYVAGHAFNATAGTDRSNGNGYLILPPIDPFVSAEQLRAYVQDRFAISDVGVIISDSHGQPFRYGVTGFAVGFSGFVPLESHVGKEDLFGNKLKAERSNIADAIASATGLLMGESSEQTPVVVVRGVPNLTFQDGDLRDRLFAPFTEDVYRVLYEDFLT